MSSIITFKSFNKFHNTLTNIHKSGVQFGIEMDTYYSNYEHIAMIRPRFEHVDNFAKIGKICEGCNRPIGADDLHSIEPFFRELLANPIANSGLVQILEDYDKTNPNIKYVYKPNFSGFGRNQEIYHIARAPREDLEDGTTYRTISNGGVVLTIPHQHPMYNYMDQTRFIIVQAIDTTQLAQNPANINDIISEYNPSDLFITNNITLDVCYIKAMFALSPETVTPLLDDGVYLDSTRAKPILMRAEKNLPARHTPAWLAYKAEILTDFQKNAQNIMVSKLRNGALAVINMHGVQLRGNRATYDTISIEAPDLIKIVFNRLNPNEYFDINMIIAAYAEYVSNEFETLPLNETLTGFAEAKSMSFSINDTPITVSVQAGNTRRKINDMYIKKGELIKVITHAVCFQQEEAAKQGLTSVQQYHHFVRSVELQSLDIHNIMSNGFPVKIFNFSSYESGDATPAHPRLFFKFEKSKYYIWLNKEKTECAQLSRFVEFVEKVRSVNRRASGDWGRLDDTGAYGQRNAAWAVIKIKALVREYATEAQVNAITNGQLEKLIADALVAREKAEAKSEEFLASVVKDVKAEKVNWSPNPQGHQDPGYAVTGVSGTRYYVNSESLACFSMDSGEHICIVDAHGQHGVGRDRLATRLMVLSADSHIVSQIYTLAKHVKAGAVKKEVANTAKTEKKK